MTDQHKLILAAVLALGVMAGLWKPIFGNLKTFLVCLGFGLQSDWVSALQGRYLEDRKRSNRLMLWWGGGLVSFVLGLGIIVKATAR